MNDHTASLVMTCGQYVGLPLVIGFLHQIYGYKSIINQTPPNDGLTQIPYTIESYFHTGDRTCAASNTMG